MFTDDFFFLQYTLYQQSQYLHKAKISYFNIETSGVYKAALKHVLWI